MIGPKADALSVGLQDLLSSLAAETDQCPGLDLGVVTFANHARVAIPMAPLGEARLPKLAFGGGSALAAALALGLDLIADQSAVYQRGNVASHRPWVVVITDGPPTDDISNVLVRLHSLEASTPSQLTLLPVVLDANDVHVLPKLSTLHQWANLSPPELGGLFRWLSEALLRVLEQPPGTQVLLPPQDWKRETF
jgi:uncharacterized protein YegL